ETNDITIEDSYINYDNRRGTVKFLNNNCETVTINRIEIESVSGQFKIINTSPLPPKSITNFKSMEVIVEFEPISIGEDFAKISAILDDGSKITATVSSNAIQILEETPKTFIQLVAKPERAKSGETVNIQLVITDNHNTDLNENSRFVATLVFDSELLGSIRKVKLGNHDDLTITKPDQESGYYEMKILVTDEQPAKFRNNSLLLDHIAIATLGRKECTNLIIENFRWIDDPVLAIRLNDSIFCTETCEAGGTRLLKRKESGAGIQSIAPNPANEQIEISYSILDEKHTKLYITDIFGREVVKIQEGNLKSGKYTDFVDTKDIPSGMYMIILRTPTEMIKDKIYIVK
ncbi:T9SS type A sorting domain-containing protein, partial [Bacteroidota bacterium]